jgi:hypothetical protein
MVRSCPSHTSPLAERREGIVACDEIYVSSIYDYSSLIVHYLQWVNYKNFILMQVSLWFKIVIIAVYIDIDVFISPMLGAVNIYSHP